MPMHCHLRQSYQIWQPFWSLKNLEKEPLKEKMRTFAKQPPSRFCTGLLKNGLEKSTTGNAVHYVIVVKERRTVS